MDRFHLYQRSGLSVAAAVLLALGTLGCRSGASTPRLGNAIETKLGHTILGGGVPVGATVLFMADHWRVRQRVTIEEIRLTELGTARLLATRVMFSFRKRDGAGVIGEAGLVCTDWPVKGFGPTFAPAGFVAEPRDAIMVNAFVRAGTPGKTTIAGVDVRYRIGGRRYLQHFPGIVIELDVDPALTSRDCRPFHNYFTGEPFSPPNIVGKPGVP